MSQTPVYGNDSIAGPRSMPPMTWNGTLVGAAETATHYLHLAAFPCEKCNGPVIAGSLGKRHDVISQETDITPIGAVCLVCGFRPDLVLESSKDHRFRPVEWNWIIRSLAGPKPSADDPLTTELSQEADRQP